MKARLVIAIGTLSVMTWTAAFADDTTLSRTVEPRMRALAQVEVLTRGTLRSTLGDATNIDDAQTAYGITGAFDYAVLPYLRVGIAPRLVLHIAGAENDDDPDEAFDLRARVVGDYELRPGLALYASLSPGYTMVQFHSDVADHATGFVVSGAAGVTYDLSPTMFLHGEVGYQRAVTRTEARLPMPGTPAKLDMSYAHIGLGAGTRF